MKNPLTKEWVSKAEDDWKVAQREWNSPDPVYNAICFHCQQCIEKYEKAILQEEGQIPPKTPDLVALFNMIKVKDKLEIDKESLIRISAYATYFRYPRGVDATGDEAKEAIELAEKFRKLARKVLGIEEE